MNKKRGSGKKAVPHQSEIREVVTDNPEITKHCLVLQRLDMTKHCLRQSDIERYKTIGNLI